MASTALLLPILHSARGAHSRQDATLLFALPTPLQTELLQPLSLCEPRALTQKRKNHKAKFLCDQDGGSRISIPQAWEVLMLPGCPSRMCLYPLQWHSGAWCPDIPTKFLTENIPMWGSGRERCAGRLPADKSRLSGSCSALKHSLGSCKKQTTKELCDVKPTPFEYHLRVRAFPLELRTDEGSGPYRRERQHRAEQTVSACRET